MFKEQLVNLMGEKNLRAADVSRDTKIPYTTVIDWVNGKSEPSLKYVKKLTEVYELPPEYFMQ